MPAEILVLRMTHFGETAVDFRAAQEYDRLVFCLRGG
jgi:hypothetical protein